MKAMKKAGSRRSGTILICVLACMAVVSGLMIAITRSALSARREAAYRLQIQQADLLLDAGVQRAAAKLSQSADYEGETWQPTAAIRRFDSAKVTIKVAAESRTKAVRSVVVTASLGHSNLTQSTDSRDVAYRTTRSHRFQISTP